MSAHFQEPEATKVEHGTNNGLTNGDGNDKFTLGKFCIDEARPIKVIVIGAGYSGTDLHTQFRYLQRVPNMTLTIYEAEQSVGGTWLVNKYPGLKCDIPSHCYQLTFEENPNWSSFYASGPEIRAYLEAVVDKYKLMPYIRTQHRMTKARYSEPDGKWIITIRRPVEPNSNETATQFEEFEDICDVLFTGMGDLSRWNWPEIPGLKEFQGKVIHSARWETGEGGPDAAWEDTVHSWGNKRVGVIGVGSSAIQIVPAIQPKVARVVNYVRGKTWISSIFVQEPLIKLSGRKDAENYDFTEEDKQRFQDPVYYKKFRRELESGLNDAHAATIRGNPLQDIAKAAFKEIMVQRLAKKPWIADHIIPDFGVACRRLTPGPGYLEALCEDNVDFVPSPIKTITPTGIETEDGDHKELDVIVCATGFDTSWRLPFIGRNGTNLSDKFASQPKSYLSIAIDGFPNWFQALGPNSGVGAGSLLLLMERQVDYAVAATLKLQRERLKSIEVKSEAVDDFDEYLMVSNPQTVFGEKCRSWYKAGKEEGRVSALWPGSPLHAAMALKHPRWEDFNYERLDSRIRNRLHWFGDGNTVADKTPGSDKTWYLSDDEIDYPPSKYTGRVIRVVN
ncbi:FAD/NAD-binding domain-containing protein [Guyanagaster necrorhizus]|uniref:FAD/NAD-binding domain-containing protein n=1 Tax=Guyanagaster necrorhizus TaxID=856835 RepID=A0A9P7W3N9_9AGAR|nr:FAD/NAD-binding domain-containing protein [Guyanagaster necrorhizus MCA 3950]KAG7452053.1 FAD/NAD-binding domain-containing protein [Guyanagaster necrorhizus MCA 3950]